MFYRQREIISKLELRNFRSFRNLKSDREDQYVLGTVRMCL